MFEDKYKKTLNDIKAPEDTAAQAMKKARMRKGASNAKSWIAAAACLAIIIGAAGIFGVTKGGFINNGENYDKHFGSVLPSPRPNNSVIHTPTEPQSYETVVGTIMAYIETVKNSDGTYGYYELVDWGMFDEVVNAEEVEYEAAIDGAFAGKDYTDTTQQVDGVQEADIIKTDGKRIYTLNGNTLSVFSANNGDIEFVSSAQIENGMYCKSLILLGNKLAVIYNRSSRDHAYDGRQLTVTDIYTVSDDGEIQKDVTFIQSGYFVSCREQNGKLYVITTYNSFFTYGDFVNDGADITDDIIKDRLPVSGMGEGETLDAQDILIPAEIRSIGFTVVSGLDIESEEYNTVALMDVCRDIYMSSNTLYTYSNRYVYNDETNRYTYTTDINRFSLQNGDPKHTGAVCVDGSYLNQYSFDEYNGYLRIAVNRPSTNDNAVIILDKDLNTVSEVAGMGKGEQVKSVRFYGDIGYVVTFRQTDPLYALDLSDPASPKILSELKIPGFSTYLKKFGEDLLFGFGYDADESTGITTGIKLSMFDISDGENTCEKHTALLGEDTYFYDDVLKSVVVDPSRNLIMFPYYRYTMEMTYDEKSNSYYYDHKDEKVYAAYIYGENGFELLGEAAYENEFALMRGIRIGDYIYVFAFNKQTPTVESYTFNDFTLVDSLK